MHIQYIDCCTARQKKHVQIQIHWQIQIHVQIQIQLQTQKQLQIQIQDKKYMCKYMYHRNVQIHVSEKSTITHVQYLCKYKHRKIPIQTQKSTNTFINSDMQVQKCLEILFGKRRCLSIAVFFECITHTTHCVANISTHFHAVRPEHY